ncbi:MAG: type II toxin-antitoxin system ParD family antitoxin [Bacteroidota bacterium]
MEIVTNKSIDMSEKTSITLGTYFDEYVKRKVAEGRFKNISEVVQTSLQLLKEEEGKLNTLKKAIQDGIDSNVASGFGPTMHLRELKKLKSLNE